MKQLFISLCAAIVFICYVKAVAQETPTALDIARGIVYLDANRNGGRDEGEAGIEGVPVSNQIDVVLTDAEGRYALPVTDETIIFVTKPAGFMTPADKNNIPKFYYVHQPKASPPNLKYKGVDPTGPLPESIDFPLYPAPDEPAEFTAVIMGDPQPRNIAEIRYLRDDIVAELLHTPAVLGVALGDIMFDDLSIYDPYIEVIGELGIPFYNVPGNHDMNYKAEDERHSMETWKRVFGPPYYSFNYGDVHFIVIDNVNYLGLNEKGNPSYEGRIGAQQLTWIKNNIAHVPPDKLIVLMHHIPLKAFDSDYKGVNTTDREELLEILAGRKRVLDLAGHMHTTEHLYLGEEYGWGGADPMHVMQVTTACGAWWSGRKDVRGIPVANQGDGTPNGYHLFQFKENQYTERYYPAHLPEKYQLRVSWPRGEVSSAALAEADEFVVNVFNGSEKNTVVLMLDDGEPMMMKKKTRKDPFIEKLFEMQRDAMPDWIQPENSSHIWVAPIPGGLEPGIHTIRVETTDQWGAVFNGGGIFEIVN